MRFESVMFRQEIHDRALTSCVHVLSGITLLHLSPSIVELDCLQITVPSHVFSLKLFSEVVVARREKDLKWRGSWSELFELSTPVNFLALAYSPRAVWSCIVRQKYFDYDLTIRPNIINIFFVFGPLRAISDRQINSCIVP